MRWLALPLLLCTFALASCGQGEGVANTNSAEPAIIHASGSSREHCVNLNTAAAEELITLPGIGEVIARRIIDYRERHGRFRRSEEIIIVQGFSERKYRAIAGMICVD